MKPLLLLPASQPGSPRRVFLQSGYGDDIETIHTNALAPFVRAHTAELSALFPAGLEVHPLTSETSQIDSTDYLISFQPQPPQGKLLERFAPRFELSRRILVNYENPIAYHYRRWHFEQDFLALFGKLFTSAAVFADEKKFFWVPNWNFLMNPVTNEPVTGFATTPSKDRRFLAVNPIRTGVGVSPERIELIDFFAHQAPACDIFGARKLFETPPINRWLRNYAGEIPYTPSPYPYLNKLEIFSRYRFVLVIENAFTDGYVSEKLAEPLAAVAVPIYFGYPHIARYLPNLFPNGPINGHDFSSLGTLLSAIERMGAEEYESRCQTIIEQRSEYLRLTSHYEIWKYILAVVFDLSGTRDTCVHDGINKRLAVENLGEQRSSRRKAIESLIAERPAPHLYEERVREILFEPASMPRSELLGSNRGAGPLS
jgi:hypothetical protein